MKNDLLKQNEIYNRQLGLLLFCAITAFNLTRLPRIIVNTIGNMVLLTNVILALADIIFFTVGYIFITMYGYDLIKKHYKVPLIIILIPTCGLLLMKFSLFFASSLTYITTSLFRSVPPYLIIITFFAPIFYMAFKGIVPLARTAGTFFWVTLALIVFDLVFIDARLNFRRLLPLLTKDPLSYIGDLGRFGIYTCEILPFLFIKVKKQRLPYVGISIGFTYSLVIIIDILTVVIFGYAVFSIENAFASLSIFNEFSATLGKLDWVGIVPWLIMVTIAMSVLLWAVFEIGEFFFKKRTVGIVVFSIPLLILFLAVGTMEQIIDLFANFTVGYAFWIGSLCIPLSMLILGILAKKKETKMQNDGSTQKIPQQHTFENNEQGEEGAGQALNETQSNGGANKQSINQQNEEKQSMKYSHANSQKKSQERKSEQAGNSLQSEKMHSEDNQQKQSNQADMPQHNNNQQQIKSSQNEKNMQKHAENSGQSGGGQNNPAQKNRKSSLNLNNLKRAVSPEALTQNSDSVPDTKSFILVPEKEGDSNAQ